MFQLSAWRYATSPIFRTSAFVNKYHASMPNWLWSMSFFVMLMKSATNTLAPASRGGCPRRRAGITGTDIAHQHSSKFQPLIIQHLTSHCTKYFNPWVVRPVIVPPSTLRARKSRGSVPTRALPRVIIPYTIAIAPTGAVSHGT